MDDADHDPTDFCAATPEARTALAVRQFASIGHMHT